MYFPSPVRVDVLSTNHLPPMSNLNSETDFPISHRYSGLHQDLGFGPHCSFATPGAQEDVNVQVLIAAFVSQCLHCPVQRIHSNRQSDFILVAEIGEK